MLLKAQMERDAKISLGGLAPEVGGIRSILVTWSNGVSGQLFIPAHAVFQKNG